MKKLLVLFLLVMLLASCAAPAVSTTSQTPATQPAESSEQQNGSNEAGTDENRGEDIVVPPLFNEKVGSSSGVFEPFSHNKVTSLSQYESLAKKNAWIPFDESMGKFSSAFYGSDNVLDHYQSLKIDIKDLGLGVDFIEIKSINKYTATENYYYNVQSLKARIDNYLEKGEYSEADMRFMDFSKPYAQKASDPSGIFLDDGIIYHYRVLDKADPQSKAVLDSVEYVSGDFYIKITLSGGFKEGVSLPEGAFITKLLTPASSKDTLLGITKNARLAKASNQAALGENPYAHFVVGVTNNIFHAEPLKKLLLENDMLVDGMVDYDPRWGRLKQCKIDYSNGYQFFQIDYRWGEYCFEVYSEKLAPQVYEWEKVQIELLKNSFSGNGDDIIRLGEKNVDENGWYYSSGLAYRYVDGKLKEIKFICDGYFVHFTRLPVCFYTESSVYYNDPALPDYSEFNTREDQFIEELRTLRSYGWLDDYGYSPRLESSFIADLTDPQKAQAKANDFIKQ